MNFNSWIECNKNLLGSEYEILFAKQVLPLVEGLHCDTVTAQYHFIDSDDKNRYCDFTIVESQMVRIAIEIDGYDKRGTGTGMSHEDFLDWQRRQASLTSQGWYVLRFANLDVRDNPHRCAEHISNLLKRLRKMETELVKIVTIETQPKIQVQPPEASLASAKIEVTSPLEITKNKVYKLLALLTIGGLPFIFAIWQKNSVNHIDRVVPTAAHVEDRAVSTTTVHVKDRAVPVTVATTDCPEHFVDGQAPVITQPKIKTRTQELCFSAFAVLHSGVSRTPLYAAEHLTRDNLAKAKKLSHKDSFHAEPRLPAKDRAELEDYQRSGYDRGHLAPNADMPTREAQGESFSLANMVPQIYVNNAGVWAGIEAAAQQWAIDEGELYVVSGPAFIGSHLQKIGNVLVPTHLWKAVYSPKQQRAGVYLITNDDTKEYAVISVADLEKTVGLNVLPGVPVAVRTAVADLPKPVAQRGGSKNQPVEEEY